MAIKLIKKRQAGVPRPAPVVAPASEAHTPQPVAPITSTTMVVCTFCKHAYAFPCHGQKETCMNRIWKAERIASEEIKQ